MLAAVLILGGCQIAPQVAVTAGVSLLGIANQDALAFLKFTNDKKAACPAPKETNQ